MSTALFTRATKTLPRLTEENPVLSIPFTLNWVGGPAHCILGEEDSHYPDEGPHQVTARLCGMDFHDTFDMGRCTKGTLMVSLDYVAHAYDIRLKQPKHDRDTIVVWERDNMKGKDRWVAFPNPQVVFQYHDGLTGELLYAESVVAR